MASAILLIAHGSRRAQANADLVRVAESLQRRIPNRYVEIAYLELAEPDIPAGLRNCVAHGVDEIRILPYFLSAGAHVTDDLETARVQFLQEHPRVKCELCPPLGLHPGIIDALLDRLEERLDHHSA